MAGWIPQLLTGERNLSRIIRIGVRNQRVEHVDNGISDLLLEFQSKHLGLRGNGQRHESDNKEGTLHGWLAVAVMLLLLVFEIREVGRCEEFVMFA